MGESPEFQKSILPGRGTSGAAVAAILCLSLVRPAPGQLGDDSPNPTPVRQLEEDGWTIKVYRKPAKFTVPPTPVLRKVGEGPPPRVDLEPEVPTPTLPPTPIPPDPSTVIVAAVDGRRLTRAELNRRVEEPIKKAQVLMNVAPGTIEYEEVRTRQEGILVRDWTDRMLLAEEAKRRGFILDEKQFEKQFRETIETPQGKARYENTIKTLGLTPTEVRSEFYDTLLGDKVVEEETIKFANDDYLRERYRRSPGLFSRPAQVHVLHYSQTLDGTESKKDLRTLRDQMEEVRGRIAKGESPADIAEAEGGKLLGAAGLDLGWINPVIHSLPLEVQEVVAKLDAGETSRVILSEDLAGRAQAFHIVKVTEKRPAAGDTFESAKPLMLESLKEGVRTAVLERLRGEGKHEVIVNLSGIPKDVLEASPEGRAWSAVRNRPVRSDEKTESAPPLPRSP